MTDDSAHSTPDPAATPGDDQPTDQAADQPRGQSTNRSSDRDGGGFSRRQVLTGSGLAALGLAGAAVAGHSVGSRNRGDQSAAAKPTLRVEGGNGMNVVVVVLDTIRRDDLGAYGGTTRTPNLDAFAASATRFTRAYPEMLPTIPVRRGVHTGLRGYPASDWTPPAGQPGLPGWQPVPEHQTTLSELLKSAGYSTAMLADTPHLFSPSMNFSRGFDAYQWKRGQKYDRYRLTGGVPAETASRYLMDWVKGQRNEQVIRGTLRTLELPEQEQPVAQVFGDAADMLDELAAAQPFMLMLDTFEPHEPWIMPSRYVAEYGEERFDGIEPTMPRYGQVDGHLTEQELERMKVLYAANLTYTDRWLGRFLDGLTERGLDASTLVFILSDHGIMLGEHGGIVGKPSALPYPEVTDLTLLVRHPERGHGAVDDRFAANHDVPATIIAALDLDTDKPLDGRDLLSAGAARRSYATCLYAKTIWARDDRWLLMGDEYGDTTRLFDLTAEGGLERDVAGDQPEVVQTLLALARRDAGGEMPRYPDAGTL